MEIVIVIVVLACLITVAAAIVAVAYAAEARSELRALDRDRHYLNRTMTYQHPRSIR